jgi:hypothetical protein
MGETTAAGSPPPDVPRADAEPPGDAALREAEHVECPTEFGRGQVACFHVKDPTRCPLARWFARQRTDHVHGVAAR